MKDLSPVDNYLHGSWEALGNGAPMLVALAQLCSDTWVRQGDQLELSALSDTLSPEAKTILFAARERGLIEIRAVNSSFDAAGRILAVYVEMTEERTVAFRDSREPKITLKFLGGFRLLCASGLVIHHIYRDFSLSPLGLELAGAINIAEVEEYLEMATEFGLHD